MPTKYERVYEQIKSEIAEIKDQYDYIYDSASFGHLILKLLFDISDDEANEAITDGFDDNGIDAVYFEKKESKTIIHFFQFKFPSSEENICSAVSQDEILKLFNGFEHFIGNSSVFSSLKWNELLKEKREFLLSLSDTDNNVLHIVRYTSDDLNSNIDILNSKIDIFKSSSGNNVFSSNLFAKEICDLYENAALNIWPDFTINYKKDLSPFEDSNAKICSFYVSLFDLYSSFKHLEGTIFEGNVRYFDESSKINIEIINTLKSQDCSRFHLLNNGITVVCSSCNTNSAADLINIKKGSVINGAQTVGCVLKVINDSVLANESVEKFKNSYVFLKVIQIEDKQELVDELVYTLNTQNQMRSSYSLSNDPQIKAVQRDINNTTKYFFQIKNNEFNHQKNTQPNFSKLKRNIIDIETAIQAFVAYENISDLGYVSKNNKATLFNEINRTKITDEISKKKIIESYEAYLIIMRLTSLYRSYRKDCTKTSILSSLEVTSEELDNFRFINTGNFLILYAAGLYCKRKNIKATEEIIIKIIKSLSSLFINGQNLSNMTRTKEIFDKAKNIVETIE